MTLRVQAFTLLNAGRMYQEYVRIRSHHYLGAETRRRLMETFDRERDGHVEVGFFYGLRNALQHGGFPLTRAVWQLRDGNDGNLGHVTFDLGFDTERLARTNLGMLAKPDKFNHLRDIALSSHSITLSPLMHRHLSSLVRQVHPTVQDAFSASVHVWECCARRLHTRSTDAGCSGRTTLARRSIEGWEERTFSLGPIHRRERLARSNRLSEVGALYASGDPGEGLASGTPWPGRRG